MLAKNTDNSIIQAMNDLLKKLRTDEGLTQAQMAEELDISRPSYSEIERGKKELTRPQIAKISKLFDVSFAEIIEDGLEERGGLEEVEITADGVEFDPEKLRQVILYVLELCGGKPNMGETVLYKILYFIDFDAFELFGEPVTGMTYRNLQHGPVPKHSQFREAVDQMMEDGVLVKISQQYHGYRQKRYVALDNHDGDAFSKDVADLIEKEVARLSDMNASKIESYVHEDAPWAESSYGEAIDYKLVFSRSAQFAQRDYREALEQTALGDTLEALGDMPDEEREYYDDL